jgi:DNA mismatch endonuclease (patch repair protein)
MDTVTPEKRSKIMSRIRGKDTQPEWKLRRYLFARGFRYRLHDKRLPGHPDVVLAKHHVAIFVHGCFWHQHPDCRYATHPKSNVEFWEEKFRANRERDGKKMDELLALGWKVVVVWECELKGKNPEILPKIADRLLMPCASSGVGIK